MHILITGGAGFIGSHLAEYHLSRGHKVHAVDDMSTGSVDNISAFKENGDFRFDEADVLTWPDLGKAVVWADRIYHMAAVVGVFKVLEEPIKVLAVNVAGTERLLRAAHSCTWNPHVVVASSSEVYGRGAAGRGDSSPGSDGDGRYPAPAFREDMEPVMGSSTVSRWNYSISKVADEAFGLSYARRFGMKVIVVRLFNTIGPRQMGRYGMVVPRFVEQAVSGHPITVYGDGSQQRSFCDVRDVVKALDLLADNPRSVGEIVNVGNNREISIRELAELIKQRAGSDSAITYVPYREAYGADFEEVYHRKPDLGKLLRLTDFRHQWSLEQTIDDLIRLRQAASEV